MKNNIFIGTIAILFLFASCKTVQYQEFGSFGGGKFSSDKSLVTDSKTAITVDLGSKQTVDIEDSDLTTNITHTKTAGLTKLKNITSNPKIAHEKSRISIKQVYKAIQKIKSAPKKQLSKEIKNQKQIFGYEGENNAMTFGFNLLMYSLISFILGIIIYGLDISYSIGVFLNGWGILGIITGSIIWISGWLSDISIDGYTFVIIFLSILLLGLLILSMFAF